MYVGYLAVVFLTGFAGVLHAQRAEKPCSAPTLENGYVVPDEDTYAHDTKVSYACEDGHKPAAEGWWATTTCENGLWSPVPQCIDAKLCFPPNIPNGKYKETQSGWYDPGTLRVTCDKGYKFKDLVAVAKCENGLWSSVPTCEKSSHTCGEPPKVPHAVIINQEYQELFAVDFKLQYECEDGYTVEGGEDSKSIFCISGRWTEGPTCRKKSGTRNDGSAGVGTGSGHTTSTGRGTHTSGGGTESGTGQDGLAGVGTGGGHTTSTGRGTHTSGGGTESDTRHDGSAGVGTGTESGTRPDGSAGVGTDGGHTTSAGRGTHTSGGGTDSGTIYDGSAGVGTGGGHTTSAGRGTHTSGGGSSTTVDRPATLPVENCGKPPNILNGDVSQTNRNSLKYQCNSFYKLIGSDTVVCYSDGTWSDPPVCKDDFCVLDPAQHQYIKLTTKEYMKEGEMKYVPCNSYDHFAYVQCRNGQLTIIRTCCHRYDIHMGFC